MTVAEYNNNVKYWSSNVLRFAVWNCGDRMRGEDAMQEAFAKLWEHREDVNVEKGLSYLLIIARRYLVDCFRHDNVVTKVHQEISKEQVYSYNDSDTSMGDKMAMALTALPEIQRTIMQLRDVEGYSYEEIAQMLDINKNQVQVYLFRARTTMRKILSTHQTNETD